MLDVLGNFRNAGKCIERLRYGVKFKIIWDLTIIISKLNSLIKVVLENYKAFPYSQQFQTNLEISKRI